MSTVITVFSGRRWVAATFLGWLLGVALLIILSSVLDAAGIEDKQFYLGTGMGAGIGLAQWLRLRKQAGIGTAWIGLSVLGMSIPFLLADLLFKEASAYKLPACVAAGALLSGWLQQMFLHRKGFRSRAWLPFSFAGWLLAATAVLLVNYTMSFRMAAGWNLVMALLNLLLILSGGYILGLISYWGIRRVLATGE